MVEKLLLMAVMCCVCAGAPVAQKVKVTVLSTQVADARGVGEWGFAALVEASGQKWLFDTGARPETVLTNCRELGIDLSDVQDVVLSHFHGDHTGGLMTLRREFVKKNAKALSRVWVARGFLFARVGPGGEVNPGLRVKREMEASGGSVTEVEGWREMAQGVWLTGPVPRKYPERNWSGSGRMKMPDGKVVEDTVPDDMALVANTEKGLMVVTGCGHAGIVNITQYAREKAGAGRVDTVIGGMHLFAADEKTLGWTAGQLKGQGVRVLMGTHCTGLEAVYRLRALMGLSRENASAGSVGASYTVERGLEMGPIAR